MKKITFIFILLTLAFNSYSQRITFQDILNGVSNALNTMGSHPQDLFYQSFIVNSSSNAKMFGGHDKMDVQVILPANTINWYYRVTVVEKNSNFEWPINERLISCIQNGTNPRSFATVRIPINVYLLNNAGDNYNFSTGKRFTYQGPYSVLNTDSFFGQCNLTGDIWLGIQNVSPMVGSKVILEIVAIVKGQ